jgi:salicylate hydroxylase
MLGKKMPVIIVGGGLGGLTMAIALAQKDIPSIVLEQANEFRETGAGIQLCPNVFKIFDRLNIIDSICEISVFPDNLVYIDGINGHRFLEVPLGDTVKKYFKYPYGVFHRVELLLALVKECRKYPIIQLVTGARIIDVVEKENSVVAKTEQGVEYEGEILIGCDGLWSIVRNFIVGEESPRFTKHVAHRGVVSLKNVDPKLCPNNVVHWVRDDSHLVHYPISTQGMLNIIAIYQTEHPYSPTDIESNPKELHEKFEGSQPEILELLKHINFSRKWQLYDRDPIKNWSKGRSVLLGDSAHPTLPYLTQGAGMAIEDAYVLSNLLTEYKYPEAFKRYEEERYLRTSYVQLFSRAYGHSHHSSGVARELRNFLISRRTEEENFEWLSHIWSGIEV